MSVDPIVQVRDYLDSITQSLGVNEIVQAQQLPEGLDRQTSRRGPLVASFVAALVLSLGALAMLIRPFENPASDPPLSSHEIVDVLVSGSKGDAVFAAGLNAEGEICATAGTESNSGSACGRADDLTAVAFQTDTGLVVAGFGPSSMGGLTAVFDGQIRRPVNPVEVPGRPFVVFGVIEHAQPTFVEIEITDTDGDIIERYFPSIGPYED